MKKLKLYFIEFDESVFMDLKTNIIVALYVDDIFIIDFSKVDIKRVKSDFNVKFHISDLRLCVYYLGMIVKKNR